MRLFRSASAVAVVVAAALIPASGSAAGLPRLTNVTVAMGFLANVQFAPFYVAQSKGYYRKAGLNVHFRYGIEPDLLKLASLGKVDFVNSGGDEVLTAGAQGLHVKYVLTQYSRFPSALFALRSSGIRHVSDLKGRSIGIPGRYGASYVGLLVLLRKAGIPLSSVSLEEIGFTQLQSVANHKVDAAVGYANNEPVELRQEGQAVQEFDVYHWVNLAGAGVATGDAEIKNHPTIVRKFVAATVQGMKDTLSNPNQAFVISEHAVPEITAQPGRNRAVLDRSLSFWRAERGQPLGWIDVGVWKRTAKLLLQFKQIPHAVAPSSFYTNRFVPR